MARVVIGNLRTLRASWAGSERISGFDGESLPKRRPRGRYVMDPETGAIKFEHDIGPQASTAVVRLERASANIQTAIESLKKPAVQSLMVAGGAVVATLAVVGLVYWLTRPAEKKRKRKQKD